MKTVMLSVALLACAPMPATAADNEVPSADETAIREAVRQYVEAFNRSDAKALAAFWSPEAVYLNPRSGEQVVGRDAIEQQFTEIFAEAPGTQLAATTHTVQFVSPNVAVEHGTASVVRPDQSNEESAYTAVYVKRDGQWLLDRVTEGEAAVATDATASEADGSPAPYEQLKVLDWMVGTWIDEDEDGRVETTCAWTKNQTFLTVSFTLSVGGQVEMAGMQIVAWDPVAQQIRSWVFDSDGGFGEGTWTHKGNAWNIQLVGTLADGRSSSATNIITYVDPNRFTWQSVNREVDGELLPNVDEVVAVRETADGATK